MFISHFDIRLGACEMNTGVEQLLTKKAIMDDSVFFESECDIADSVYNQILSNCSDCYPHEAIGLLWSDSDGSIVEISILKNGHANPELAASVPLTEIMELADVFEKKQLSLAGCYHSHIDGKALLSGRDYRQFRLFNLMMIVALNKYCIRNVAIYRADKNIAFRQLSINRLDIFNG